MKTNGLNHIGLSVLDLDQSVNFFVDCLGWKETGRDPSYPRSAVSDGSVGITLWQVDSSLQPIRFNRKQNVGLHHLAIEIETEPMLKEFADKVTRYPGVTVEFLPENVGNGPRKHMMFSEPGGIRLELIWLGE